MNFNPVSHGTKKCPQFINNPIVNLRRYWLCLTSLKMIPKSVISKSVTCTLLSRSKESRSGHTQTRVEERYPLRDRKTIIIRKTLDVHRFPSERPGRDFTRFNRCHLMCQYGHMDIDSTRSRVKVLNPGSFDGLLFMKNQLLKYSVITVIYYDQQVKLWLFRLLLINKGKAKYKTETWVSVWRETKS